MMFFESRKELKEFALDILEQVKDDKPWHHCQRCQEEYRIYALEFNMCKKCRDKELAALEAAKKLKEEQARPLSSQDKIDKLEVEPDEPETKDEIFI